MKTPVAALCLLPFITLALYAQSPNVVVIISDDGGYADWEFMDGYLQSVNPGQAGSPVPTPSLNKLRNRGVLFTSAYTAAVCSPSRAAIVTGSYQQRMGYEYNINNLTGATAVDGLHPDTTTIFHRMKAEGYTTGVIGKWHLGARANDAGLGNRPENMAVDEFFGIWKGSRSYPVGGVTGAGTLRETIRVPFSDTILETTAPWNTTYNYVTSAFGKGALDFIDRHHDDPNPFFLYVAFTAPHSPIGNSPDINDARLASLSDQRKKYASMVLTMDKEIGGILDKIDDPAGDGNEPPNNADSLTANTLVIFINDNGGASGNGTVNTPLRNWKGSTYEGGTRVPMIIAGPGIPTNAATPIVFDRPVHSIDILPTCLAAAGATPPDGIDGVNLIPFLDGSNPGDPHELITIRNGAKVGVRRGEWKLTKNATGVPFELYDLATDITESTNRAADSTTIVEELVRAFTVFEAGADKPRHAGLNNSADSINLNDRFLFNPSAAQGPTATGPNVIRNPGFENGTQADADARLTFAELDDWSNNGTDSADVAAIDNDSHSGTYRGVFVLDTRIPYQLTDHTIAGGETMLLDFWHKGKSGWDAADTITVDLFYLDGTGAFQALTGAIFSPPTSGWTQSVHLFPPFSDPNAIGRTLGIRFRSNGAASEFVSIDDILLTTGTNAGAHDVSTPWSADSAWIDPDTGLDDTLLSQDAFAGATLEFPTRDAFSYTATNDMTRVTDLTFMLNQLHLTGTFTGTEPRSAAITGKPLLLTAALDGTPPALAVTATGTGFTFRIDTELVLYDNLSITGDGNVAVELTGAITDYGDPRAITKSGTSTVLLSGNHTCAGQTTVSGGTLVLAADGALAQSAVVVEPNGTLGGDGSVAGGVSGRGTIAPGRPIGVLTIGGHATCGSLAIEVDGASNDCLDVAGMLDLTDTALAVVDRGIAGLTEPVYVIASYGSLNGSFASVTGLPPGYALDYAYDDGVSSNNIALAVPAQTPFTAWSAASGLSGPDAIFTADSNGDGVPNGLAFFLGAADANQDATPLLPWPRVGETTLDFLFDRADAAATHGFRVEYRHQLAHGDWTTAQDGVNGVHIAIADNGAADRVTVSFPADITGDGRALFARLVVQGD